MLRVGDLETEVSLDSKLKYHVLVGMGLKSSCDHNGS